MFDFGEIQVEMPKLSESKVQDAVVRHLKSKYKKVRFISSLTGEKVSGARTKTRNAKIQHSNGQPDMFIYARRGGYVGLALELKRDGEVIYKKDGTLRKSDHLEEQQEWLDDLTEEGWYAVFSVGLKESVEIINWYLNLKK